MAAPAPGADRHAGRRVLRPRGERPLVHLGQPIPGPTSPPGGTSTACSAPSTSPGYGRCPPGRRRDQARSRRQPQARRVLPRAASSSPGSASTATSSSPSDTFGNVFGNSIHAIRKVSHRTCCCPRHQWGRRCAACSHRHHVLDQQHAQLAPARLHLVRRGSAPAAVPPGLEPGEPGRRQWRHSGKRPGDDARATLLVPLKAGGLRKPSQRFRQHLPGAHPDR